MLHSVNEADSQVSRAAKNLTRFNGSTFSKKFVKKRIQSWQAHLERISPFLAEGVWWREFCDNYLFRDGDNDPDYHSQGPTLLHFRNSSLEDVANRQKAKWKQIIDQHVHLPTTSISIYDQDGKLKETRTFSTVAIQSLQQTESTRIEGSGFVSLTQTPLSSREGTGLNSLTHTPISALSSTTESSGLSFLTQTSLSDSSSAMDGGGLNSLTQIPLSALSSATEGSGLNSLIQTPLSALSSVQWKVVGLTLSCRPPS